MPPWGPRAARQSKYSNLGRKTRQDGRDAKAIWSRKLRDKPGMSVSLEILAPLLSLAFVLVGTQVVVALTSALRTREYRNFEDRSAGPLRDEFAIPPTSDKSEAEDRRRMFSPLLDGAHSRTNATQTSYHNAVARSTGALAVA